MATNEQSLKKSPEQSGAAAAEQPVVSTDAKVEEVSAYYERLAGAGQQAPQLAEQELRAAEAEERARYEAAAVKEADSLDGSALAVTPETKAKRERLSLEILRELAKADPAQAVQKLEEQALQGGGVQSIRTLLEQLAAEEGGAAVMDQVHDEIKKREVTNGEQAKGDAL